MEASPCTRTSRASRSTTTAMSAATSGEAAHLRSMSVDGRCLPTQLPALTGRLDGTTLYDPVDARVTGTHGVAARVLVTSQANQGHSGQAAITVTMGTGDLGPGPRSV